VGGGGGWWGRVFCLFEFVLSVFFYFFFVFYLLFFLFLLASLSLLFPAAPFYFSLSLLDSAPCFGPGPRQALECSKIRDLSIELRRVLPGRPSPRGEP